MFTFRICLECDPVDKQTICTYYPKEGATCRWVVDGEKGAKDFLDYLALWAPETVICCWTRDLSLPLPTPTILQDGQYFYNGHGKLVWFASLNTPGIITDDDVVDIHIAQEAFEKWATNCNYTWSRP